MSGLEMQPPALRDGRRNQHQFHPRKRFADAAPRAAAKLTTPISGARIRMFQPDAMDMETAFMKLTEGRTA